MRINILFFISLGIFLIAIVIIISLSHNEVDGFKNIFKQLDNGYNFNKDYIKYYPLKGPFKKISDIKDIREKGETRLRKNQYVQIRLLLIFDFVCNKFHIPYWLSAGTLLGAVRHKGFIPWDNDIDIRMLKKDYIKLKNKILSNTSNIHTILKNNNVFFQCDKTEKSPPINNNMPAKFRDKKSCYLYCKKNNCYWHDGFQLDIFVSDINDKDMIDILDENFNRFLIKKNDMFPLRKIKFENNLLPVPNNYNEYLTKQYGNFMKLPPPQKRYPHEPIGTYNKPC